MPKYRVYLTEGRQIDLDAETHTVTLGEKGPLTRLVFSDRNGKEVAVFNGSALQGFTRIDNLVNQKDPGE